MVLNSYTSSVYMFTTIKEVKDFILANNRNINQYTIYTVKNGLFKELKIKHTVEVLIN